MMSLDLLIFAVSLTYSWYLEKICGTLSVCLHDSLDGPL